VLWTSLLAATPVRADDPHPPQLNVTFLAQSAAIVQDGATRLYYEMVISNFIPSRYERLAHCLKAHEKT
jgi:hypothetical protein